MFAYLKFELRCFLRESGMLVFTVLMPVASYAVFSSIGDPGDDAGGISVAAAMMIGLAGYGAVIGVLSHGASVSVERTRGWLRQLRLTPLRPSSVVIVKGLTSTLAAFPPIIAVGITGHLEHGITLSWTTWLVIGALLWAGTAPFALLGLAMGYGLKPALAQPASFLAFFTLSTLGGLLVPVQALPVTLQHIAVTLPTNRYAELGWSAVAGHAPTPAGMTVLGAWTLLFAVLALVAFRRSAATR